MYRWCRLGALFVLCLIAAMPSNAKADELVSLDCLLNNLCNYFYQLDEDHDGVGSLSDYVNRWKRLPLGKVDNPFDFVLDLATRNLLIARQFLLNGIPLSESPFASESVTINEFLNSILKRIYDPSRRAKLEKDISNYCDLLFNCANYDKKDDYMTRNELLNVAKVFQWTVAEVDRTIGVFDKDKDGKISKAEFRPFAIEYFTSGKCYGDSIYAVVTRHTCDEITGFDRSKLIIPSSPTA